MYNLLRLITWKLDPLKVRLATCCSCFCDHQSTRILKWIYIEYIWSVSMKFLPQFLAIFKRSEHSSSYYIKLFKAFYYHLLFPRNVLYIFILRESNSRNCKFNIIVRIFRWYFDYFDNIFFFDSSIDSMLFSNQVVSYVTSLWTKMSFYFILKEILCQRIMLFFLEYYF